jgi:hypothetical protein
VFSYGRLALACAISDRWPPCMLIIVSGLILPLPGHPQNGALFMTKPVPFAVVRQFSTWDIAA